MKMSSIYHGKVFLIIKLCRCLSTYLLLSITSLKLNLLYLLVTGSCLKLIESFSASLHKLSVPLCTWSSPISLLTYTLFCSYGLSLLPSNLSKCASWIVSSLYELLEKVNCMLGMNFSLTLKVWYQIILFFFTCFHTATVFQASSILLCVLQVVASNCWVLCDSNHPIFPITLSTVYAHSIPKLSDTTMLQEQAVSLDRGHLSVGDCWVIEQTTSNLT